MMQYILLTDFKIMTVGSECLQNQTTCLSFLVEVHIHLCSLFRDFQLPKNLETSRLREERTQTLAMHSSFKDIMNLLSTSTSKACLSLIMSELYTSAANV